MTKKTALQMSMVLDAVGQPRITNDGYLTAMVRAARTGVQKYRGFEVGEPQMKEVIVYRPEEEVFSKDSLHSYAHKPTTNDHPPVTVDSENWAKYGVGHTGGEVARDGEFVVVPLVLMDQEVIDDYRHGKKQLSLGYSCDLVWDSGNAPDGTAYDAVQRNIRANHLAVVANARGGPDLRIGDDNNEGEGTMTLKAIMVDGLTVEMTDIAAQQVQKTLAANDARIATLDKELKDARAALAKAETDAAAKATADKAALEAKDAEVATLKKQAADAVLTPAQQDALVSERVSVVTAASKILGDKLVTKDKTVPEIRRQVVNAYMGDAAKDWKDEAITASFNTITAKPAVDGRPDPLVVALSDNTVIGDKREESYKKYAEEIGNAWKNKKPATAA